MEEFRLRVSREQLMPFHRKSAWRASWMLIVNWGLIVAAFALVIRYPGLPSVLLAMAVIGGRQLGLGILMHECAHRSFMPSVRVNDWVGQWLCAAPIHADLAVYRAYHMTHHRHTGTADDPDLPNYAGYPVTPASFARKLLRDLSGLTGLRAFATLALLYSHPDPSRLRFGYAYRRQTADEAPGGDAPMPRRFGHLLWNARRVLLVQALAFGGLWALGHPLAYLLWPGSWITSYMIYSRIRNAAEHGGLPGTMGTDVWNNTRSVRARWWERLTVAPNFVNFHLEHHLVPTVPSYNLPRLHRWLHAQGVMQRAVLAQGYGEVVGSLVRRRA